MTEKQKKKLKELNKKKRELQEKFEEVDAMAMSCEIQADKLLEEIEKANRQIKKLKNST